MNRLAITTLFFTVSAPAFAHVGHIAPTSGHAHYLLVGAGIVALAIGAGAFFKAKRTNDV